MSKLIFRPYIKRTGKHFKIDLYSISHRCYMSRAEIKELRDLGHEIEIEMVDPKKNVGKRKICEKDLFLRLFKSFEPPTGNVEMMNRIIRAGGFLSYIRQLEG